MIQNLWIIEKSGIVVFSKVINAYIQEQLFGALMSALSLFSSEIAKGYLEKFELSDIRFTIIKSGRFLFVADSAKNSKEKKVNAELIKISKLFFEKYNNVLKSWAGDITVFYDFEEDVKNVLEKPVNTFWKRFSSTST